MSASVAGSAAAAQGPHPDLWARALPLLGLAVLLVVAGAWLLRREEALAVRTWEARLTGSARTQARALDLWATERSADAVDIASSPLFQEWERTGSEPVALREWLNAMRDAQRYRAILLRSGNRELRVGDIAPEIGLAMEQLPAPPLGRTAWQVVELPGGVVRVLAQRSASGLPGASVTLVVDPATSLFKLIDAPVYGTRTGEVSLVESVNGSVMFFSPGRDSRPGDPLVRVPDANPNLAAAVALSALPGAPDFGRYVDFRGIAVYAATQRDTLTGWGLIRKVQVSEVLEPVARARIVIGAFGVLIFLLASLIARVTWLREQRGELRHRTELQEHELTDLRLRATAVEAEARAARLARLLDDSGEEVYILNAETLTIELANRRAAEALGYDLASLCRRTLLDLAPLLPPTDCQVALDDLRAGRRAVWEVETEHQRRDGSRYPVAIAMRYSTAEDPPVFVSLANDITSRITLETMLRQSQKMEAVGRLAGGVAHDFNNILTVIQGVGSLALEAMDPSHPARADVEQMLDAAQRAAALTAQLLAFSRRQIIKPAVVSMNDIVTHVKPMLERLIGEDIDLEVRLTDEPVHVLVDCGQIDQVLMNLVVNSRDAMAHGGRLTIETSVVQLDTEYARKHLTVRPGPHVMLAVSDTGVGMDATTRAHIFEPFFTTKGAAKGTGLGLATVYGIVKQCGGNVWVYSEPGQGATFKIYFPSAGPTGLPEAPEPLPLEPVGRGHETVLVVEDDAAIRDVVVRVLEVNGYTVQQASDGEEGLAVAQMANVPIHLLLTDVVMPRLGGRALADRLAVRRPRMRVLYMSGFTDNAIVHHHTLDQGVEFLQKPFTPAALLAAVRATLDRR